MLYYETLYKEYKIKINIFGFVFSGVAMGRVTVKNHHIATLKEDIMYHIGLATSTHNLKELFGDVKVT